MLWEIVVLLVVVWLVRRRWYFRKQIALMNKMSTNLTSYPLIGHIYMLVGSGEDRMRAFEAFGKDALQVGGISPVWWNELYLCVADPVAADILMNQCLEKIQMAQIVIGFLIGGGSLYAPVPIWRSRRKMIVPTFSMKNLNRFVDVFSKRSIVMNELLRKEVGKEAFSFWNYIADCNLDTVCENTLGVRLDTHDIGKYAFKEAIDEICRIAATRICKPWFHSDFMFKFMSEFDACVKHRDTIREFISKIIKEKKKLIESKKTSWTSQEKADDNKSSFLDHQLASDEQKLSDIELLEEIIVLVMAGLDTSATGAGFTALMLGKHPDIQEKVYEELREVFGDSDSPVTAKDLHRLKYLDIVIKETLRLFPPVPIVTRRVDNDVTLPSGLTVVKGAGFLVNIWAVHRNPTYWGEDADQFRPERFLNFTPKHPAAFMPFSYGFRNCIGYQYAMMSMKTVLATLLRQYKVLPPPGVTKEDPVKTAFDIMLRHVDKFQIRLEYRK